MHRNAALKYNARDPQLYNNRGSVYGTMGEHKKGIADFGRALEVQPEFAPAYRNRGHAYHQLGDTVQAAADFQNRAQRLDPSRVEGIPQQYLLK